MSGGKKPHQIPGWEEAGSEFYQENYGTDFDTEVFHQDPKHLTTLLPSKQTRTATIRLQAYNNKQDYKTFLRHTLRSKKESTMQHRRCSNTADIQVAMLPDLSENLSNEQTMWEEIMLIKAMPLHMHQKKQIKYRILNEPNLRLQGYEQLKWKHRKLWQNFVFHLKDFGRKIQLWQSDFKIIEGYFGNSVVTYFRFMRWLLYINMLITLFAVLIIVIPTLVHGNTNDGQTSCSPNKTNCCLSSYTHHNSSNMVLVDFFEGTGIIENSLLFYGFYSGKTYQYPLENSDFGLNFSLAYITIILLYFGISFISILILAIKSFKERLIEREGQFYRYCNLLFSSWDFCIKYEKMANYKKRAIYTELKDCIKTEQIKVKHENATFDHKLKSFLFRFIVNSIIVAIIIMCGCIIYYVFNITTDRNLALLKSDNSRSFKSVLFELLPSITIVCVNMFVPIMFKYLAMYEHYNSNTNLKVTLIRLVILRLSTIIVLFISIYTRIFCRLQEDDSVSCHKSCNNCICWENYFGQQIYKLILTDLLMKFLITFLVNYPRSVIAKHTSNVFLTFIGEQTFDLPNAALDVIYLQTLSWVGFYFVPLLPALICLIFIILFYVNKFSCLINSKPSFTIYNLSRLNSMFIFILLLCLIVGILPVLYSMIQFSPSQSCGPFCETQYVWKSITDVFMHTPEWIQIMFNFLFTKNFVIPIFVILVLVLYYYVVIYSANKHMVAVLKSQLVLEGHDKQFLLERLSLFIKQQHENYNTKTATKQMK